MHLRVASTYHNYLSTFSRGGPCTVYMGNAVRSFSGQRPFYCRATTSLAILMYSWKSLIQYVRKKGSSCRGNKVIFTIINWIFETFHLEMGKGSDDKSAYGMGGVGSLDAYMRV